MNREKILITGATGNVGRPLFESLRASGFPVLAAGRDVKRTAKTLGVDESECRRFDFGDPAGMDAAMEGVSKLFLVRPPEISDVKKFIKPCIEAALRCRVEHIVFLSVQGAGENKVIPHHAIEKLIRESWIGYTFLRPAFFMQNLSTTHRDEIVDRDEIFVPAGRGKTAFIDIRDIAAVAHLALTHEGHRNHAYELTGTEAPDYFEVAAMLSQELGRTITYRNPGAIKFVFRKLGEGLPLPFAFVMTALYTVARLGKAGHLTDVTAKLLGRPPITLRQFIADNRHIWLSRK